MGWRPRPPPAKTVDQAVAALLPLLPKTSVMPRELVTDEDVLAMIAEMEKQDPTAALRMRAKRSR